MNIEVPGQARVISFYGPEKQSMIHCEELAELIQAVSKMRRAKDSGKDDAKEYFNLVEELGDTMVCIEQIKTMYDITDGEIQRVVSRKCARQEERMHDAARRVLEG
ncbi:MAG: hypothetical protein IIZ54_00475 [Selenomonadaceae bacterium]|nr:hypothetical protein [Selenomonadaceae bacterium]